MSNPLDVLLDDCLRYEFEESPSFATGLGAEGYDHLLGDYSAEAYATRDEKNRSWLSTFEAIDDLDAGDGIDRDLACSTLRGRVIMSDWAVWKRDPAVYLGPGLSGVFRLFLHRLHDEDELTRSACSRLEAVPRVLEDGRANLDPELVSRIFVDRAK